MTLNESIVENAALEWFGEQTRCARTLTRPLPRGEEKDRETVRRLNPAISEEEREEALRKVLRVGTPSLVQTNRAFHRMSMKPPLCWCVFCARIPNPF